MNEAESRTERIDTALKRVTAGTDVKPLLAFKAISAQVAQQISAWNVRLP